MVQGSSCIIILLEVEAESTLECSNDLSQDYTGLVLVYLERFAVLFTPLNRLRHMVINLF